MALERLRELPRLLGAPRGVLFEASEDDVLQLFPDLGADRARRLRDLVDDPVEHRLHLSGERRLSRQTLVHDGAERVDVGPSVEGVRADLFGGKVRHGPDESARLGQAVLGGRLSEAEVHDPDPRRPAFLARDHDVLGLDVAVDHVARVAVLERIGDLDGDVENFTEAERSAPEDAAQVRPLDDRHHEKERAVVAADVVDRDDPGMVHLSDDLRLALESLFDLGREFGRCEDLHGDVAIQHRIAGPIDDSHAAAAELGRDLVAVAEPAAQHVFAPGRLGISRRGRVSALVTLLPESPRSRCSPESFPSALPCPSYRCRSDRPST